MPHARSALSLALAAFLGFAACADPAPVNDPMALAAIVVDRSATLPDDLPGAEAMFRAAMEADSGEPRWPLALGALLMRQGRFADARPHLERAVELAPENADALAWLANALFMGIEDANFLAKGRMAGRGKDLLERAVALDPDHVSARISLVEFYRQAPGIAGGSTRKAREHAEALTKIPRGAVHGHRLLAFMAIEDEDWDSADVHLAKAMEAAGDDADARHEILLARGYTLLDDKGDAAAALPFLREAFDARGGADGPDTTTTFLYARALAETGDCAGAIPLFERVLALNPEAMNTRFFLASCFEKSGRASDAIGQYEEFLRRFPKGDMARRAQKALKALREKQ